MVELNQTGFLTHLLNTFISVTSLGYTKLAPEALNLMSFFVTIEIVILGIWWAFGSQRITTTVIKKLTLFGVFLWLVSDMHYITKTILLSFGKLGIVAGSSNISINVLCDPSKIIALGYKAVKNIITVDLGFWDIINPLNKIYLIIAAPLIIFSYAVIAFNIFFTIVEYYIFTMFSVILIPFGLFKPTSFLSDRAISHTFSLGIKFMVLSFFIGFSYNYLESASIPSQMRVIQLFNTVLSSAFIAFLVYRVPSLVSSYIMGMPGLSMENLYESGKSVVSAGVSGYSGLKHIHDKVTSGQSKIRNATRVDLPHQKSSQANNRATGLKSASSTYPKKIDGKNLQAPSIQKQNLNINKQPSSIQNSSINKEPSTVHGQNINRESSTVHEQDINKPTSSINKAESGDSYKNNNKGDNLDE